MGECVGLTFRLAAKDKTHLWALDTPFSIEIEFEEPGTQSSQAVQIRFDGGKPVVFPRLGVTEISSEQRMEYVGVYHSDETNGFVKIMQVGEQLVLRRGYTKPEVLQPVTLDFYKKDDLQLRFERDEHHHVRGFSLMAWSVRNVRFTRKEEG